MRTLFGPVDDSGRRPRAAVQITRAIRKKAWYVRYLRQPLEPADFEDFSQNAYMLILEGVHSTDRSWEDVFRVPLSRRLWNLVRNTRIELGRQGLTGNPEKGKTYAKMPPMLVLETIENTAAQNTETTNRSEILDRAVVALKAALSRLHPWLQAALEVDEVGRLVPAHHVALEYDRSERTVKQWRARARQLFRRDPELVALLRELGFRVKEDS